MNTVISDSSMSPEQSLRPKLLSLLQTNLNQNLNQIEALTKEETFWDLLTSDKTIHHSVKVTLKDLDPRSLTIVGFIDSHHIDVDRAIEIPAIEEIKTEQSNIKINEKFNQKLFLRRHKSQLRDCEFVTGAVEIRLLESVVENDRPDLLEFTVDTFFPPVIDGTEIQFNPSNIEPCIRELIAICLVNGGLYEPLLNGHSLRKNEDKKKPS